MFERFEISRIFDAPRERVWSAWTEPQQLEQWLPPQGTTSEVKHFELQTGGYLHSKLTGIDGSVSWGKSTYREIDPPSRLVWEQSFSNEAGEIVPAPFPMPWPSLTLTSAAFIDGGSQTRVTLSWQPINPTTEEVESFVQMLPAMRRGWSGTFEQLDVLLRDR